MKRPIDEERAKALISVGADVLVIDSSQGNSIYQEDLIKKLKSTYGSSVDVNICSLLKSLLC
jgi:hypothetical protein